MANTYKSKALTLNTTGSNILYTVPTNTTTLIKSCYCGNTGATNSGICLFFNKSGSATDYFLVSESIVPKQAAFQPITEPIILEESDVLKTSITLSSSIDILLSYLELT